jgi:hypothetical protein
MFADDSRALAHTASYSAASAHSKLWRMASVKRMAAAQLPLASEWAAGAVKQLLLCRRMHALCVKQVHLRLVWAGSNLAKHVSAWFTYNRPWCSLGTLVMSGQL